MARNCATFYLLVEGNKIFRHFDNKIYFDSTQAKHEKLKYKENTSDVECRKVDSLKRFVVVSCFSNSKESILVKKNKIHYFQSQTCF